MSRKKKISLITFSTLAVILCIGIGLKYTVFKTDLVKQKNIVEILPSASVTPTPTATVTATPTVAPTKVPTPIKSVSKWPVLLSLEQAESLTVVVNKKHKLPSNYAPPDLVAVDGGLLRSDAAKAYSLMKSAAAATGKLSIISSYRSYQSQANIYNNYVARDGQALADTYSARPGFSEHQTGLAVDIGGSCALQSCFGGTPIGRWLDENAATYGFIVRYPKDKQAVTGYQYEPWHMRYLGNEIAKAVKASGKTLDEFYTMPAGSYQ